MAEAGGISRQSYAAIESGESIPSTEVALRLARALGRPVEELFRLADRPLDVESAIWGGASSPVPGQVVRFVHVRGCLVAHPLGTAYRPAGSADGLVEAVFEDGSVGVRCLADRPPQADLVVVGCDPAFGLAAELLRREYGFEVLWSPRGSRQALSDLARGRAHVAGSHLLDPTSGAWNGPWIERIVPFATTRIGFATWEQGLVLRPDLSQRVGGTADLAQRGVRLLNREEGSGSRMLLDEELSKAGIAAGDLTGYGTNAPGHEAVAQGVASGSADVGVATRAAATALGLGFLPLRDEIYELVVPDHFLELEAVGALLDVLRLPALRSQVEGLPGYDGTVMGSRQG